MTTKLITLPENLLQRVTKLVGLMDSTLLGNDTYYQLRIIDILLNHIGEQRVSEMLKEEGYEWAKIKKDIERVNKKVQKVKPTYDLIEDKSFGIRKMDKVGSPEWKKKQDFLRYASKVPLFGNPCTFMYVWFVKKTNLQQMQVRNEYYKIMEDVGFRKMGVKKDKPTDVIPTGGI